jgi:hypothetical protein
MTYHQYTNKPVFESRVEYTILHIGGFDSLPNVTQVQSLNRDIYFTTKRRVDFTFHQSQYSNRTSVWRLLNAYVITVCAYAGQPDRGDSQGIFVAITLALEQCILV